MNHTDVVREVSDRLTAIGTLGERVAQGRLEPTEALLLADELILNARKHTETKAA